MQSDVLSPRALRARWLVQWLLVVILLLASNGLASAAPLWQSNATATVVIAALNIRSGPGTGYSRIGGVKKGDILTVLGQSGNCTWLKVKTAQITEGWVSGAARYVTLNIKCNMIPAAVVTAGKASNTAASGGEIAPTATATVVPTATLAPLPTPDLIEEISAKNTCKYFVEQKLVSPSSAIFEGGFFEESWWQVALIRKETAAALDVNVSTMHGQGVWVVTGKGESQNRFGVMIPFTYICAMDFDQSDETWYLLSIDISER